MADLVWPDIWPPEYDNSGYTAEDPSAHSNYDDGVHTGRRKWTKSRKTFNLAFHGMPDADHAIMRDFLDHTVYGGALAFSWRCPWDGKQYSVYCAEQGKFTPGIGNSGNVWDGTLTFAEA